ncbi:ArsR/SmtB family transcription factor [Sorangium sp. So ce381]|uniref:ArsR/SmtB family transcription factor n=1 Tax=Sorangium sp. So ce381 TaxID=3133307 RepID=UPI003F5BF7C5
MSTACEPAVADVFFALGDGTRLSVVTRLGAGGALSATALSDGAKVTRQAIVKHLRVLEGAGLVTHERRGREVLYALEPRRIEEARVFLDGISAGWDRALERLRRMVEEPPSPPPRKQEMR